MSRLKISAGLLMTSALVATAVLAREDAGTPDEPAAIRLLDPAYVAASACGGVRKGARTAFQPRMQLALATPAQAVMDTSAAPRLWDDLGDLTFAITTASDEAQRFFDQGFRLTYAFNHGEAYRAFKKAQALDPKCAMCFWGEAFVLGPNINAPMEPEANDPSVVAIDKATALAPMASERERALIEALSARYSSAPDADRKALDAAYADAMAAVRKRFPDDDDIAVLFADAVMNTSPWDYWEPDGRTAKGRIQDGIDAIESVLARNPDHPGAIHLYIHLTEASATPERAEPYADRLGGLMPGAGHLVHMPSHTYYRIGRYIDSLEANVAAVEADEAYLEMVEADGIYPYGYYPHNIHFALVSAQMAGDAERTLWAAERLDGKIPDEVAAEVGWIQVILPAPYFAHAQFSEPATVLGLPDPGDGFPMVKAMWHYARGVAHARAGDLEAARAEANRIAAINAAADFDMLLAWAVPAPDVLRLAGHVVDGRIAQAEGDLERAIEAFEAAVRIQDGLPYMEPNYWYYPVRQSLGAALLMAGDAKAAEQAFRETLLRSPNNGWALYGLMEAQKRLGDEAGAAATEALLAKAWIGERERLELSRL